MDISTIETPLILMGKIIFICLTFLQFKSQWFRKELFLYSIAFSKSFKCIKQDYIHWLLTSKCNMIKIYIITYS